MSRAQHKNPWLYWRINSRRILLQITARVQGIQWSNWLHLTEQRHMLQRGEPPQRSGSSISPRERIKTIWESWGSRTPGRLDEKRNPHKSGRTDRNWSEVFRIHKLKKRKWLDTVTKLVNLGELYRGRNSAEIFSAFRSACTKLFKLETSGKLGYSKSLF